jgi:hypothetical protein
MIPVHQAALHNIEPRKLFNATFFLAAEKSRA